MAQTVLIWLKRLWTFIQGLFQAKTKKTKIKPSEQGYWNIDGKLTLAAIYEQGDSFAIFHGEEGNMELTTCSCSSDGSLITAPVLREGALPSGKVVRWYNDDRFALFAENGEFIYSTGFGFLPRTSSSNCDDEHSAGNEEGCDDAHECTTGQAHQFGGSDIVCLN